jgi:hypothetical protein
VFGSIVAWYELMLALDLGADVDEDRTVILH